MIETINKKAIKKVVDKLFDDASVKTDIIMDKMDKIDKIDKTVGQSLVKKHDNDLLDTLLHIFKIKDIKNIMNNLINQTVVDGVERGFVIDKNFNNEKFVVDIDDVVYGDVGGIDLAKYSDANSIGSFHTHKSYSRTPTVQDYIQSLKLNHKFFCIGFGESLKFNKVRCYVVSDKLREMFKLNNSLRIHNMIASLMFTQSDYEFKLRK